ncbi:hypothetical protein [Nocardia asteroides]|uniref:Uncharacterized protein n=1 Tax=Nocardia asteroides NBRC 15531 TaxID=1110697 RepID=U5ECT6_NOCAS|nr:hypothetical protein [Nocardia asteroides]TLF70114.1 hypothetical protein FEK33_07740 [Nocardia asteroides NBRC 15531]UGT49640.1 hypothetical protein LT345_03230 [Nocardia asteroides]SFL96954.1 hypothetical protein SAMN05444423_1011571 [Nocardia asteroides]VEG37672.1 Uncharacterised protein [Nocardia asteroides]GAD84263.1 hypothetical protein NCAST_23_00210 [Nocardia asteroides NBRC 15531]
MEMNSEGLQLLAGSQGASSLELWASGGRLTSAAAEYAPGQAGRDYQYYGTQIQAAMEAIGVQVAGWAAALEQHGSGLTISKNAIVGTDDTAAAGIGAVDGTL